MAVEVFRGGVHDEVRAEVDRAETQRGEHGGVDAQRRVLGLGDGGGVAEVSDFPGWVRGGLDPDEGALAVVAGGAGEVARDDAIVEGELDAASLAVFAEEGADSEVGAEGERDAVADAEEGGGEGGGGRHAGGEERRADAAVQRREHGLRLDVRRIIRTRVHERVRARTRTTAVTVGGGRGRARG